MDEDRVLTKGEEYVKNASVCVTRDQIVAEARSWIGVPWRHQGRNRSGVDCVGLAIAVSRALGVLPNHADKVGYSRLPTLYLLVETAAVWMRKKTGPDFDDRQPGDIVFLRPNDTYAWPSHLGILTRLQDGELGLVHAYNGLKKKKADVVLETHYTPWWPNTVAVMEMPGLVEGD